MDGRGGVQPTDTNGSVGNDGHGRSPAPATTPELAAPLPLTIREVVRRGREDRSELDRLRAEVDRLRLRAESAEDQLRAILHRGTSNGQGPISQSGPDAADGQVRAARQRKRSPGCSTGRWATAAVLPRSQERGRNG